MAVSTETSSIGLEMDPQRQIDDAEARISVAAALDMRRWEADGILPSLIVDWRGGAYAALINDNLDAVLAGVAYTFNRASTADYVDRDGVTQEAALGEPCLDFSEGGRGILIRPADSPRAADIVGLAYAPQKGGALVEFYPPQTLRADGTYQGVFTVRTATGGVGVSAAIEADTGLLILQIDDGTVALQQQTLIGLYNGLNRLFLAWDLALGSVSFSLNGGPVVNYPGVIGWNAVTPTDCQVGRQNTFGGLPREYDGVIASAAVYGSALGAPLDIDGTRADAVQEMTRIPARIAIENGRTVSLAGLYGDWTIANRESVSVISPSHVRLTAKTGDHAVPGDDTGNKVRSEFGDPAGWVNNTTLYITTEIFLPSLSVPGAWGLVMQGRQGGGAVGFYDQPPFALILDSDVLEAVVRKGTDADPEIAENVLRATLPVTAGNWHRLDLYQEWSAGETDGSMRIWVDGLLIVDYTGILGQNRSNKVRITMGMYRAETMAEAAGSEALAVSVEFRNFRISDQEFEGPWTA